MTLVLTRKESEGIVIDGPANITVGDIKGNRVKILVDAPASTHVRRKELTVELPAEGEQDAAK